MKIKIDGVTYDVPIVSCKRVATLRDGPAALETQSGTRERDLVGTYYDYELVVSGNRGAPDYDAFFEAITAPVNTREIVLPYGSTTTGELTYAAMVRSAEDQLTALRYQYRRWQNLKVRFEAQRPQRT